MLKEEGHGDVCACLQSITTNNSYHVSTLQSSASSSGATINQQGVSTAINLVGGNFGGNVNIGFPPPEQGPSRQQGEKKEAPQSDCTSKEENHAKPNRISKLPEGKSRPSRWNPTPRRHGRREKAYNPPLSNPYLVRRKDIWQLMENEIEEVKGRVIIKLCGMEGVGKTQLAADVFDDFPSVRRFGACLYQFKVWFDARSKSRLQHQYVEFYEWYRKKYAPSAEAMMPLDRNSSLEVQTEMVRAWLSSLSSRFLIIYDDIFHGGNDAIPSEFEQVFLPYESSCHHILVTCNTVHLHWRSVDALEVEKMGRDESVDLLESITGVSSEDLVELADALHGFPLALEQAASYVYKAQCSVDEYLKIFDQKEIHFPQHRTYNVSELGIEDYKSVWVTLNLCLDEITCLPDASRVGDIFEHLSWLGAEWIPNDYLISVVADYLNGDERTAKDVWNLNARPILQGYGLIRVRKETEKMTSWVSVHAITQRILQDRSKERGSDWSMECWRRCCRVLNEKVFGYLEKRSSDYTALWGHAEALHEHADMMAQLELNRPLDIEPTCLGCIYLHLGLYRYARAFYSRKHDTESRWLSPNDPRLAETKENLGYANLMLGDHENAQLYLEQALRLKQDHSHDDKVADTSNPLDIAETEKKLGILYRCRGKFYRAKKHLENALKTQQSERRSNHTAVTETRKEIGKLYLLN